MLDVCSCQVATRARAPPPIEGVLVQEAGRQPDVWLVAFGDSSLNFELVVWVDRRLSSPGRTQAKLLWALETELGKRGLVLPFPQRDLHIQSGPLRVEIVSGSARPQE
jgi:small-conductance mechanosensitive channel